MGILKQQDDSLIQQEVKFEGIVRRHLNDAGWAQDYLKSGLPQDLNLGGMTPHVFKKFFLVERPFDQHLNDTIEKLFCDENHNLLCIESDRGSGKSTFIRTIHLMHGNSEFAYDYPFPCIDFSKRQKPRTRYENGRLIAENQDKYNENQIFRKFRRRYSTMFKSKDKQWYEKFYVLLNEAITKLEVPDDDDDDSYLDYSEYIEALKQAAACKDIEAFNEFNKGHLARIRVLEDCDIKILLLLYLFTFISQPVNPKTRWIIVFDSIEVYVKTDADMIASAIGSVYDFIEHVFDLIGLRSEFFTRFTAIFPIRTATSLSFIRFAEEQGKPIWGSGCSYIFPLPRYDFATMALLKKLKYLIGLGASDSLLYQRCVQVASLMLPRKYIDEWLRGNQNSIEAEYRRFAKTRLMPLFNYDYRSVIDRLYDILPHTQDDSVFMALEEIQANEKKWGITLENAANGENMIATRLIFDTFHNKKTSIFEQVGYKDFDEHYTPGIARTAFNFLYYDELEHYYNNAEQLIWGVEYPGVSFSTLLEKLKPFAKREMNTLAEVLFNSTILVDDDPTNIDNKQLKLFWTYLIVIKTMDTRLSLEDFTSLVAGYYTGKLDEKRITELSHWKVKLSDAGRSFTVWASKQYEFLLARAPRIQSAPLFAYSISEDIPDSLAKPFDAARHIIEYEGINRLIDGCMEECEYCKKAIKDRIDCVFSTSRNKTMFNCSLFHRYQECLMMIVDSIDYIDRFRVYVYQVGILKNENANSVLAVNKWLLQEIAKFNMLFVQLEKKVESYFDNTEKAKNFFDQMSKTAESCKKLRMRENSDRSPKMEKYFHFLERMRLPRFSLWYYRRNDLMEKAIKDEMKNPGPTSLYDLCKKLYAQGYHPESSEAEIVQDAEDVPTNNPDKEKQETIGGDNNRNYVRILHLSDLHFESIADKSMSEKRKTFLRVFKKKLASILEVNQIDYICFTGDIANTGSKKDFDGAVEFFKEILQICKLSADRLLICPGNHDQYLRNFYEKHPDNQKEADHYLSIENLQNISKFFTAYSNFCKAIGCAEYSISGKSNYLIGVRHFDQLSFVCLNTAWLSMNKNLNTYEHKKSWVGSTLVDAISNQIAEKQPDKVVTIMHHPSNEWEEQERQSLTGYVNVWAKVTDFSDVILCGHTHQTGTLPETVGNAEIIHGGCLYENNALAYENCFYLHTISLKTKDREVKSDKYLFLGGKWSLIK